MLSSAGLYETEDGQQKHSFKKLLMVLGKEYKKNMKITTFLLKNLFNWCIIHQYIQSHNTNNYTVQ